MICECRAVCARALHGTSTELEIIRFSSQSATSCTLQYVDACLCLFFCIIWHSRENSLYMRAYICTHMYKSFSETLWWNTFPPGRVERSVWLPHFEGAWWEQLVTKLNIKLFRFSAFPDVSFADHESMESCKRENQENPSAFACLTLYSSDQRSLGWHWLSQVYEIKTYQTVKTTEQL